MPWTRSTRRGPWLPNEDTTLLQLVRSQGPNNWVRICQHMQHRSPKQCRERYHQNLKPSLNHEPITIQEGDLIEQMVREMGHRWAEIARRLGNRSDNAIKNWWNGSMNRRKRTTGPGTYPKTVVGPRTQPIPAGSPARSALHPRSPSRHLHPPTSASNWNQTNVLGTPSTYHLPAPQAPATFPSLSAHYLGRPTQGSDDRQPAASTLYFHSYTQPLPSPREIMSSFPRNESSGRTWPSPRPALEPPLVSPIGSEWSRPPSLRQAPSLVSDNLSTYSVSPKTVPSPRPGIPTAIDTNLNDWKEYSTDRRHSVPTFPSESFTQGSSLPDEGYVSALPVSAGGDVKACTPPELADKRRDFQNRPQDCRPQLVSLLSMSERARPMSPSDLSPSSAKDARMHVASILH